MSELKLQPPKTIYETTSAVARGKIVRLKRETEGTSCLEM
jgi:hypothetical protein